MAVMRFHPKTWTVDLSRCADPQARAALVAAERARARDYIGYRPTHVLADRGMLVDLDLLDLARLRVVRRPMAFVDQHTVKIAAEVVEPLRAPGGPARIQAQLRLM